MLHGNLTFFLLASLFFVLRISYGELEDLSSRFSSLPFEDAYSVIWGNPSIDVQGDTFQLKLDKSSGSGIVSQENYMYGFYSASIKFPAQEYAAGIVLAFYTSNADEFPDSHDELDFEFLGNIRGRPWRMQTNIYGNGSVARGREERLNFWFDPTTEYHNYSILWNRHHIVFSVDGIPIREMVKSDKLAGDYPSKPMGLYTTMWDGSTWATDGGKYPVDYKYGPFVASFREMKLQGCASNPLLENLEREGEYSKEYLSSCSSRSDAEEGEEVDMADFQAAPFLSLSHQQRAAMSWVRSSHLYYSYCDDKARYPTPLPECSPHSIATPSLLKRRRKRSKQKAISYSTPASITYNRTT